MGPTIIAAVLVLGAGVLGMCFNVIFRKKDFPEFDVGSNEEMRRRGIRCYKDEDAALHRKKCAGKTDDACKDCKFYEPGSDSGTP
ncbi:MAG: hypothetical protein IJS66_06005 [Bacteroidales bacterium]|nr:hypothetical protein [Bacteroidales bacterium]